MMYRNINHSKSKKKKILKIDKKVQKVITGDGKRFFFLLNENDAVLQGLATYSLYC